jgi:hypothetical protein
MRALVTIAAALTVLTILAAPVGAANTDAAAICRCGPPIAPAELVRDVSFVVEGVVVDKWMESGSDLHHYARDFPTIMPIEVYRLRVGRGWKGYNGRWLELDQGYTFCEHQFAIGRRYLIFVTTTDMPAGAHAPSCWRLYEGAEIPAVAAVLGPPNAVFDLPDTTEVPRLPGLRRRLTSYLVGSVAAYSWLIASNGTGRAREEWKWSSTPNRGAAIATAWGGLIASTLAFAVVIIAIVRRKWRLAARVIVLAGFIVALCLLLPGWVLLATNEWLARAALG